MKLKELEDLVDTVYEIVGEGYSDDFKRIIGGCHSSPATEWYGDIYSSFKRVLNDNVIKDKSIEKQMLSVSENFSKWFGM